MSENNEKTAVEKAAVVDKPDKPEKGDKKKKVKKKKERKHPFGDMVSELKKVTWPTKEDLRSLRCSLCCRQRRFVVCNGFGRYCAYQLYKRS